ncbi:hypothetical protein QYE76_035610 [Lolium multiflorum]|uniref:Oberon PHD finger domain-containing protein n=1 Tax=Lolium multiflorum TaxID=4521 RepID=A0AAD8R163_LOLMU|nr:hypothetical protein QYE76_035610 [Lolium multiflorum]
MKKSGPERNSSDIQLPYKRQKKIIVQALPAIGSAPVTAGIRAPTNNAHLCKNSACRASLVPADKFCKCCSCCICFKYDDNKDPSLWLSCTSDQLLQEESCGFSCHLVCAFRDERSGILQNGQSKKLDGGYYCTHCGKQNDLLGCWKKQLLIAKDARQLDVLCHRIFVSHKILISTQKYLVLHEIVDTALKKLEGELGPITGLPDKGSGIVGHLGVGTEVQRLCTRAIETLESIVPFKKGYRLKGTRQVLNYLFKAVNEKSCGHGKSMKKSGPEPNSSEIQLPYKGLKNIVVQALPVIASAPGCLSCKSTPGRIEDGGHEDGPSEPSTSDQVTSLPMSFNLVPHKQGILLEKAPGSLAPRTRNGIELGDSIIGTGSRSSNDDHVPHPGHLKPRIKPWSPSSSNPSGKPDDIEQTDENAYMLCVKVIRQLECEGHVDIHFRVKFLTWLSLRVTLREKEIVSVFVDTFTDDLSEAIYSKKPPMAPSSLHETLPLTIEFFCLSEMGKFGHQSYLGYNTVPVLY